MIPLALIAIRIFQSDSESLSNYDGGLNIAFSCRDSPLQGVPAGARLHQDAIRGAVPGALLGPAQDPGLNRFDFQVALSLTNAALQ